MVERTPYVLRMPPELHERLKVLASAEGKSMNQLIVGMLRRQIAAQEGKRRRAEERARHATELAAALAAPLPPPDPIDAWLERAGVPSELVFRISEG